MGWHWVVLEISFARAFVSDINGDVLTSFPLHAIYFAVLTLSRLPYRVTSEFGIIILITSTTLASFDVELVPTNKTPWDWILSSNLGCCNHYLSQNLSTYMEYKSSMWFNQTDHSLQGSDVVKWSSFIFLYASPSSHHFYWLSNPHLVSLLCHIVELGNLSSVFTGTEAYFNFFLFDIKIADCI